MDSTCCSYNTLKLNIGDRSWGQKAISIECVLNIEVFKIKMNHLIIFCGQAAAQHSALPRGKALISVHHVPTASSATSSALCGFCSLEAGTQARVVVPTLTAAVCAGLGQPVSGLRRLAFEALR